MDLEYHRREKERDITEIWVIEIIFVKVRKALVGFYVVAWA